MKDDRTKFENIKVMQEIKKGLANVFQDPLNWQNQIIEKTSQKILEKNFFKITKFESG
jgi:hypothetical protein